uniref:acyltransferase family protein n=1 Tax=Alistipes sp. Marseille-P5061 TaxID=2048242 RepID=UPI00131A43EA|nr:acyltransferase family protein [Alistipes sp. Marseille-P5061]
MKVRDSNIELLRIVLMILIIIWHYLVYGYGILENLTTHPIIFITPILVFPVDCFIFISGYYEVRLKRLKFISLLGMLVTYSVLTCLVRMAIDNTFDVKALFISLFPVSSNYWWFFTQYLMLILLSPMLNICDGWTKTYFKKVLLLFAFFYLGIFSLGIGTKIGCIGDLPLFVFIYLLGRYLRKYPIEALINNRIKIIILLSIISCSLIFLFIKWNLDSWVLRSISYNNPLIILMAIEAFYVFKCFKMRSIRIINIIGSTVFASYLITESCLRHVYIGLIMDWCRWYYYVLAALITILLICPFELGRKKISSKIFEKITQSSYKYLC